MTDLHTVASAVLAANEGRKAGPIGLAVILALCVICYFLFKSMSKHMRKVREQFPGAAPVPPADQTGESGGSGLSAAAIDTDEADVTPPKSAPPAE